MTSYWKGGSYAIHGGYVTCCKNGCLGAVKRATCTEHFVSKSRTTLYFLQQSCTTWNILICCKTGFNVGGKTHNITWTVLQESCITSCKVLLPFQGTLKERLLILLCMIIFVYFVLLNLSLLVCLCLCLHTAYPGSDVFFGQFKPFNVFFILFKLLLFIHMFCSCFKIIK